MRVKLHEIQGYAKTLADLADAAAGSVDSAIALWMTMHPDASVAECREFAKSAVSAALTRYGDAAATNATRLYDDVMAREGVDVPPATIYDGPDADKVNGTVRRLAGRLVGDEPDREGFLEQIGKFTRDETRRAASDTVMRNVERDSKTRRGRRVLFARVPQRSDPCGWCVMLASRGFDYKSAESAAAGNHHNCTCIVVPGVDKMTTVDGYDPEGMYDRYSMCRQTIEHDLQAERRRLKKAGLYDADAFNEWCRSRVVAEMNTRDRVWLKTGKVPEVTYADEPLRQEIEGVRPHEKETAARLAAHGIKAHFVRDYEEYVDPETGETKRRGLADLENGYELKSLGVEGNGASTYNTINNYIKRSSKKKSNMVAMVFDNSQNDELSDEDLIGFIRRSRSFRRGRIYIIDHSGKYVFVR